jgi:hypothetical protein
MQVTRCWLAGASIVYFTASMSMIQLSPEERVKMPLECVKLYDTSPNVVANARAHLCV